ncbi:MAG: bifunctional metallophosphatase/5'-nucleotidase [Ilumatobacter sp.]|nr:bifunctional metallophosphatase/5'-nucleotidase [Ilumatobacter sp.]
MGGIVVSRPVRRWRTAFAAATALFTSLALLAPLGASADHETPEPDYWLTILHNNDGESALLARDVLDDDDNVIGQQGGIALFAKVRADAEKAGKKKPAKTGDKEVDDFLRSGKRGVIFVSSGDNFLASPAFTASIEDGVFYDALALDMLKYDAIDLGNHDFDFGPDVLADFISEGFNKPGKPPYLSANLDFSGEAALQALVDDGVIAKSTIVKEKGEEIGIVGATTEGLPSISSPRNVVVNAVQPAVQAEIDALEAAGVNKIVLISHLQSVEEDLLLAEELSGIDVMIAGGGDELLANPDDLLLPSDEPGDVFGAYPLNAVNADGVDVPVVTTSGSYGYLGNLRVAFDDDGVVIGVDEDRSGPIRVVSEGVGPDGVKPVKKFAKKVADPVAAFVAELAANIIGDSEVPLTAVRNPGIRTQEMNEGNLIADSQLWQATELAPSFGVAVPDVAIANGGGIRNQFQIGPGPISEADTFAMLPFPNFVGVVPDIPRDQFKEILENAVSRVEFVDGRFPQIGGFSFTYDPLGAPRVDGDNDGFADPGMEGSRIVDVELDDGTVIVDAGVVQPGPAINVATVDFLARGGDQYPFRSAPFTVLGVSYQQALSNYIQGPLGGLITAADYPVTPPFSRIVPV